MKRLSTLFQEVKTENKTYRRRGCEWWQSTNGLASGPEVGTSEPHRVPQRLIVEAPNSVERGGFRHFGKMCALNQVRDQERDDEGKLWYANGILHGPNGSQQLVKSNVVEGTVAPVVMPTEKRIVFEQLCVLLKQELVSINLHMR